ncbi:hypothetical protein HMPREF9946_05334 [Acetobacteraceae bacterium AT-5844]|nr:hypothetical protein HMPREF9946_05334 [Acetobacteraceae bacterium AT-5844]
MPSQALSWRAASPFLLDGREEGWGKNSPDPFFSFFEFSGVAVGGVGFREPAKVAPEVLDLRRLRAQPALPLLNIIKSIPPPSRSATPSSKKKDGVWGILSPAFPGYRSVLRTPAVA